MAVSLKGVGVLFVGVLITRALLLGVCTLRIRAPGFCKTIDFVNPIAFSNEVDPRGRLLI